MLSKKISVRSLAGYYVDSLEEVKWYGWHDDMIKLSAMYPGIMFTLDGNGEDGEDVWREYFRDGMSHPANIETIYEKFDESKLK